MITARILVVDDESGMLEVCKDTLEDLPDTEVVTEVDSSEAVELLTSEKWDLLITDIRMPGTDGIELLRKARTQDPDIQVLMLTAYPSVETAVESMKLGAEDYITKPFLPDDLYHRVKRLLEGKKLQEENRLLRKQVKQDHRMGKMIGHCPPMQNVFEAIHRISNADIDVLIIGETGTGKELVARNIHRLSNRKNHNFVPVDCGAIPHDLMESEFFGHERGAFTGATKKNMGLLEFANEGTFFLDEIGQLPLTLQAKLLRVLQERKIRRVGDNRERNIDVRIIAATSLDLEKEIQKNRFRMDLYHRINVARVDLPPLRNRIEDIPLLTTHFLELQTKQLNIDEVEVTDDVLEIFKWYTWPGNVRELQNVIKKTLVMTGSDTITVEDLPEKLVDSSKKITDGERSGFFEERDLYVSRFEKRYFTKLLETCEGDVTQAAEQANMPRGTMYRLLKKNDVDPADFRS